MRHPSAIAVVIIVCLTLTTQLAFAPSAAIQVGANDYYNPPFDPLDEVMMIHIKIDEFFLSASF